MTKHGEQNIKILKNYKLPKCQQKVEFNTVALRMSSLKMSLLKVYNNTKMFMVVGAFLLKYVLFKQCKIRHSKIWEEMHQKVNSNYFEGGNL